MSYSNFTHVGNRSHIWDITLLTDPCRPEKCSFPSSLNTVLGNETPQQIKRKRLSLVFKTSKYNTHTHILLRQLSRNIHLTKLLWGMFGLSTFGRKGREVGLCRGKSWTVMQVRQSFSQPYGKLWSEYCLIEISLVGLECPGSYVLIFFSHWMFTTKAKHIMDEEA